LKRLKKNLSVYKGAKGPVSTQQTNALQPDYQNCGVQGEGEFGEVT